MGAGWGGGLRLQPQGAQPNLPCRWGPAPCAGHTPHFLSAWLLWLSPSAGPVCLTLVFTDVPSGARSPVPRFWGKPRLRDVPRRSQQCGGPDDPGRRVGTESPSPSRPFRGLSRLGSSRPSRPGPWPAASVEGAARRHRAVSDGTCSQRAGGSSLRPVAGGRPARAHGRPPASSGEEEFRDRRPGCAALRPGARPGGRR